MEGTATEPLVIDKDIRELHSRGWSEERIATRLYIKPADVVARLKAMKLAEEQEPKPTPERLLNAADEAVQEGTLEGIRLAQKYGGFELPMHKQDLIAGYVQQCILARLVDGLDLGKETMSKTRSVCCNAEVCMETDDPRPHRGSTYYPCCVKCGRPCEYKGVEDDGDE